MSEWSKGAAPKYSSKLRDEQDARDIVNAQGGSKIDYVYQQFESEIKNFNSDSGGRNILSFVHTPGDSSFTVTREGSQMCLYVSLRGDVREIQIRGGGGLPYEKKVFIRADIQKRNAYYSDAEGHSINMDGLITESLNALLEI